MKPIIHAKMVSNTKNGTSFYQPQVHVHDLRRRRQSASVKIESVAGGVQVRQLAEQIRKEKLAATVIRKAIGERIDRQHVKAIKEEKAAAVELQRYPQEEADCANVERDVWNEPDSTKRAESEVYMGRGCTLV